MIIFIFVKAVLFIMLTDLCYIRTDHSNKKNSARSGTVFFCVYLNQVGYFFGVGAVAGFAGFIAGFSGLGAGAAGVL